MIEWARPAWHLEALCTGVAPALFYPEKGEGDASAVAQAAKAVCNGFGGRPPCPVRSECLEFALTNREKHGIWGGRTERERIAIRRMRKKVGAVPRIIKTGKASPLSRILDTSKVETRILGGVQRHLMVRDPDDRRQDVIHPSEMSKADWCPRSTFFRLIDAPAIEEVGAGPSFTLENVFQEGHEIHHKWQTWLWEMGLLRGRWHCNACKAEWTGTAPLECALCNADRSCLEYREVPLSLAEHRIHGQADGDIADEELESDCPLVEFKTIGIGTLRFEAPAILGRNTRKVMDDDGTEKTVVDLEGVWRDIKRPFPSHLRQANLYLACADRKYMVFIYECKWNQQVKEFRIKYQASVIEDLLDACMDIKYAVESGQPPARPAWAKTEHATCVKCIYKEHCWDPYLSGDVDASDIEPLDGDGGGECPGESETGESRVPPPGSSGLRYPPLADPTE